MTEVALAERPRFEGEFSMDRVEYLIELRGVYDGWSVAVMTDGSVYNRWAGIPGYEGRAEVVEAFIRGEEPNGRWF